MLDKKKIKLGIAPIAWTNDDMPDLGAENSFQQCLSEIALSGFKGTELGNKFPTKTNELRRYLRVRKLSIANAWFSSFILTKPYQEVEAEFRKKCKFLKSLGAKRIGVSEQSYSIQGTDKAVFEEKYVMNADEWATLTKCLNWLGEVAQDEFDIILTYHHHMGTVIQTEDEINQLMSSTDQTKVFLLFDSGHLAYCNEDYLKVLQTYIDRIKHIHLKDVRVEKLNEIKENHLSFLAGVRKGAFTVPGDGSIDFAPIFEIISKSNYEGWMIVEAEQDPDIANPFEFALTARKYIKDIAKI
ncbi:MAG: myo-inosose-2 dehydratase [Christensenellaceae bacterium]|jgi:inosose dehydratase|nr:myo-inosose-2 dehydratase [Christensenellaceae bacterium]